MSEKSLRVLGVMTGTSCDGLDGACLDFNLNGWSSLGEGSVSYPPSLRRRVFEIQKTGGVLSVQKILELNRDLGIWYGKAIGSLIRRLRVPHVIANHGQTVAHFPDSAVTLQLGDPTQIVRHTGLTVVSHFREGDLSAGGQGAPLVPLFHQVLAGTLKGKLGERGGVAIHNLGGMSNLTYIGPKDRILAFDTGPGNCWIDEAAFRVTHGRLKMDVGGKLAREGGVDQRVVRKILKHPFFKKAPPKSTGRDDFHFSLLRTSQRTLVATATAITVESIAQAYENWILGRKLPLKTVFLCGGGVKNHTLVHWLSERLQQIEFINIEDVGINPTYVEAQAFAYFGFLSLLGAPLGGAWTGARGFGPPGSITPGKNWGEVMRRLRAAM